MLAKPREVITLRPFISGILRTRVPQEMELTSEKRFDVRRDLLRALWEVAEIVQGFEQHGDAMAVDIATALRNEVLLWGVSRKCSTNSSCEYDVRKRG